MKNGVRAIAFAAGLLVPSACGKHQVEQTVEFPSSSTEISENTAAGIEMQADGSDSTRQPAEAAQLSSGPAVQTFTSASAAQVGSARVAETQDMLYAESMELTHLMTRATTADGRDALRALVDEELVPMREALATAAPATTWFAVRPLSVSVPVLDESNGNAEMTVWSVEVFSRVGVSDPEMQFSETDIGLVWDGSEWQLNRYEVRPGPVAALAMDQYPVTAPELVERLEDHRLLDPVSLEAWGVAQ